MSRFWLPLLFAGAVAAQQQAGNDQVGKDKQAQKAGEQKEQLPPEEDEAAKTQTYSFNPLKSKKDVSVGDFYLKTRKDAKAAATRYRSATRWNDSNAEAWLKLGEMCERPDVGGRDEAKQAYEKYLELAPEAKNAAEVKKRLARL